MSTIDYSPEEKAYMQERDAALKQQVATTPEPKAVTKKTTTVKDTNPSTLATVSDVQDTNAAPVDYGSLVSNVVSGYKDVKEKAPSVLESLDTSMPWLKYAAGALGILGAGTLAYKAGGGGRPPNPPDDNNNGGRKSPSSIRDRSMIRIDPEMDVSRRMPDGRIEPTFGGTDGNRMVGGLFPADVSTKPVAGPAPENPTVPLNTPVGKAPKEMPMIEQGLANKEINAVAEGRKQEALKPVEPPKTAPKAKIPMPEGWGKGMSWLVNQHGIEGAQDFIDRYNNGKPFESHNQMEARRQEVTIRPKFSDIPKSVRKERGITAAIVPPSPLSGGGMAVPPRTGAGGRLNETGRPGEEIIHNLNPLKL